MDHLIAVRALRNPGLFKYEHYKQAVVAVAAGLIIRLLIAIPVRYAIPVLTSTLPMYLTYSDIPAGHHRTSIHIPLYDTDRLISTNMDRHVSISSEISTKLRSPSPLFSDVPDEISLPNVRRTVSPHLPNPPILNQKGKPTLLTINPLSLPENKKTDSWILCAGWTTRTRASTNPTTLEPFGRCTIQTYGSTPPPPKDLNPRPTQVSKS